MKLEIISIKENLDGSMDLEIILDKEYKDKIKKVLGIRRWSNKKFQQLVIKALQEKI